jgi:hypothetical protein
VIRVAVSRMHAATTVRLKRAGVIVGRVTDTHGHPLSGAVPHLEPVTEYATDTRYAGDDTASAPRITRDGGFRIPGIVSGAYRVWSTPPTTT